jgi:deoxyinosine 3'endonuclease (endonuclease V)
MFDKNDQDKTAMNNWSNEQKYMASIVSQTDDDKVIDYLQNGIGYVVGMDISTPKTQFDVGCVGLVVFSDILVYQDTITVDLPQPYIPGYLGFREVPAMTKLWEKFRDDRPDLYDQVAVVMIDGNGVLHPNECGSASHFGVTLDIVTIGVAKTLHLVDGISKEQQNKSKLVPIVGQSGKTWGMAMRTAPNKAIYVSVGNKISLNSAVAITEKFCKYRVPEPIRAADILTRSVIRKGFSGIR